MSEPISWPQQAENIAHHFGNGKEKAQGDGSWLTLCPAHKDTESPNLHVTPAEGKILLKCFACGNDKRKEIVDAVSQVFKISDGVSKNNRPKDIPRKERGQWLSPVPSTATDRPNTCYLDKIFGRRTPDIVWQYMNQNHEILMYNARFNLLKEDGSIEKRYRRLAYYAHIDHNKPPGWSWFGPDHKLPLYGLEQLNDSWWLKPIIIVEGEKAADAAVNIFPEAVVIAFPGGASNFGRVDWEPLVGAGKTLTVTLWPDKDAAGKAMAHGEGSLSKFLQQFKVTTKVVNVFEEKDLPEKWDLADDLPKTWDRQRLMDLLDKATSADILDNGRVLEYCATVRGKKPSSNEELKNMAQVSCASYSKEAHSPCRSCFQYRRIDKPADLTFLPTILLDWLYLTRQKMFFNIRTSEELDSQGFNAYWAADANYAITGELSATHQVLTNEKTSKVYDYTYKPNGPVIFEQPNGQKLLNSWRGFPMTPEFGTEPTLWLDLAKYLIEDDRVREHILDWLAFTVQFPEKKINHGLLLISPTQGVGKDTFIQPIREIFGPSNCQDITSRALDSEFNEYLLQTKLLVITELDTIGHRHSTYDYLKPLLASPPTTLQVNIKKLRPITIDNIVHVIAFSNKANPVALEDSDRRLMVYRIEHDLEKRWADDRFGPYYEWIRNGGSRQVMGWLLQRDLSAFRASIPAPNTKAKQQVIEASDPRFVQILEMVREHLPPFHTDLIQMSVLADFLRREFGIRFTVPRLEELGKRHNMGTLLPRLRISGNSRSRLFANRHYDFWSLQGEETLRRAHGQSWADMRSPASDLKAAADSETYLVVNNGTDGFKGF